tara:strand:+ start:490 stop:720 length:231 start_codon:yes stop_codon:yes gene_type:complete
MITKIYLKLTKQQKENKILFSSTLSKYRFERIVDKTHELTEQLFDKNETEFERREKLLRDSSFFNNSHFKYNIIRS